MGQDNTLYKCSIKVSFSSKGQNKSKLHKQNSILRWQGGAEVALQWRVSIYGYITSDMWTTKRMREETHCPQFMVREIPQFGQGDSRLNGDLKGA